MIHFDYDKDRCKTYIFVETGIKIIENFYEKRNLEQIVNPQVQITLIKKNCFFFQLESTNLARNQEPKTFFASCNRRTFRYI